MALGGGKRRVSVLLYIVVAFGVCIAAVGAVMATTTTSSFNRERQRTKAELRLAARYNADAASASVPQTLQFLAGLAAQPGIRALDPGRCAAALGGLSLFSESGNLFVLRADGSIVCSLAGDSPAAIGLPTGDWFARTLASPTPLIGDPFIDPRTGRPEMVLSSTVSGDGGLGVIAAVADPGMQPLTVPPNSVAEMIVFEVDASRQIVLAASPTAPQEPGRVRANSWIQQAPTSNGIHTDSDGVTRLYQEAKVEGLNRYIVAGVPLDVATAAARTELTRNIKLSLAVVLLVSILGLLMHRQIARPIRNLKRVIASAADDHSVRAVPEGPAEVADVALAFNKTMNERSELEVELDLALKQAQKASSLKSEFLANMSHEIRTPMNGVLGMLSLVKEADLTDEVRDYLTTMGDSAEALMSILNDLLDFSKLEAGMIQRDSAPFSPSECVDSAIAPWAAIARTKGVKLTAEFADELPAVVTGDRSRVRQIISNLVDNAVKFTNDGWITVRLLRGAEGALRFEVADSGIGISDEGRLHLFEPFVQADGTTTRRYGGTGLGLAICRQLVTFMDGTIGVDSTVGVGSTFWFELPLPASRLALIPGLSPAEDVAVRPTKLAPPTGSPPASTPTVPATGVKILIVEDNRINQKVALQMVRKLGHTALVAGDGVEAVRMIESEPVDVVLMDIQMPRMDGFEATTEMRRRGLTVPIVAMTASAQGSDRERCLEAGMDDFLAKPITSDALRAKLAEVLAKAEASPTPPQRPLRARRTPARTG